MKTYRGILFLAFMALTACDKPVFKYNSDFEGTWRTIQVYDSVLQYITMSELIIDGADGSYKNSCAICSAELCNCVSTQVGKAVVDNNRTHMRMGSNGYPLSIDEEPNVDGNGNWTMKIQGQRFYKQ